MIIILLVLNYEQRWLKRVYLNIVSNLIQKNIRGRKYDIVYQALEVTSYFWGSKEGNRALLEKIMAPLDVPYSRSQRESI